MMTAPTPMKWIETAEAKIRAHGFDIQCVHCPSTDWRIETAEALGLVETTSEYFEAPLPLPRVIAWVCNGCGLITLWSVKTLGLV